MPETTVIGDIPVRYITDSDDQEWPAASLIPSSTAPLLRAAGAYAPPESYNPRTNCLRFRFGGFLVETSGERVLIDAGVGADKTRDEAAWNMRSSRSFLECLRREGINREDIDVVITTHAHADHVGWLTLQSGGAWQPTFPAARHIFLATELDHWISAYRREASVNSGAIADSVIPLLGAVDVVRVADGYSIGDHLTIEAYPGHTPGNAVVWVESAGEWAAICGDTLHHPIQLRYPSWSSGFCSDTEQSAASRRRLLEAVVDRGAVLLPNHFRVTPSRLVRRGDHFEPVQTTTSR